MALATLTSGTLTVPYMPMTIQALACPPPVLENDFENCRIPGGIDLWSSGGFYSPGQCFVGYKAQCTQSSVPSDEWPIQEGETAVRCIPSGFDCNERDGNPRYATTEYDGTTLSAPAFEIRWRSQDVQSGMGGIPAPGLSAYPTGTSSMITVALTHASIIPVPEATAHPPADSTLPLGLTSNSTDSEIPNETEETPLSETNSSLTTGSIAGIAVGASLGTLGMTLTAMYLTIRRRRRRKDSKSWRSDGVSWDQRTTGSDPGPAVVEGQPPMELDTQPIPPKELEAPTVFPTNGGLKSDTSHISLNQVPIEMSADAMERHEKFAEE